MRSLNPDARSMEGAANIEDENLQVGIKVYQKASRYRISKPNGLQTPQID